MGQIQRQQESAIATKAPAAGAIAQAPKQELTVRGLLNGSKIEELRKVAGAAFSAERLVKIFAIASSRTPKLLECAPLTVLDAMVKCAELKLIPGTLGSAYLVPYWNGKAQRLECQLIVGYRGLVELARRSGQIESINAEVVREGDVFEFEYGLKPVFRHKPAGNSQAPITHAWALANFVGGGHQLVVMTKGEVDAIKNRSKAGNSGPWVTDYAEMAKKTAIRRLCKYLPLTAEAEAQITDMDRSDFGMDLGSLDTGEKAESLADRMKAKTATKEQEPVDEPRGGQEPEAPGQPQETREPRQEVIDPDTGEVIPTSLGQDDGFADSLKTVEPAAPATPGTSAPAADQKAQKAKK